MVSLVYRCETDEREVTLNEEHDDFEWLSPAEASDLLAETFGGRIATAVERATALDDDPPFRPVTDPYADAEFTSEEVLSGLAETREMSPEEFEDEEA